MIAPSFIVTRSTAYVGLIEIGSQSLEQVACQHSQMPEIQQLWDNQVRKDHMIVDEIRQGCGK